MVKPKAQSKKSQKHGVDFKKIKRKLGRKLPPPKNATNTEIKSKAIVLPEQSIASEKAGLAVSKKGLTLKELLQQTSHHNTRVRKDALLGIKDILLKHPAELKLHKLAVIEKLRERIGDDDKLVRETLYQLFKSVILPGCAKDNQGPLVSLMMAYIFNAMTHLAIDVRLMAFKFFDLVLQFYPCSLSLYAEKILQNYEDILRKNQFLEDKSKLKSILAGLIHCLSLLPFNGIEEHSTDIPPHNILHAFEAEVIREPIGLGDLTVKLKDLLPILVGYFQDFMPLMHSSIQLDLQSVDCMQSILQSIDLIVRVLVSGNCGSEPDSQILPPSNKPDMSRYDHFISPAILKKLWDVFPLNLVHHLSGKDDDRFFMLNTAITKIYLQLSNWNYSPALLERFLEFIESSLSTKYLQIQSGKVLQEKHLLPLMPYIPKLTMQISGDWRSRILQAFTEVFKNCNPESAMKLACLSAIEEMLAPEMLYLSANDPTFLDYQVAWIQELPSLLILLDDKCPSCSKAVLSLQLRLGQAAPVNSPLSREFDTMQYIFRGFFSRQIENTIWYGPFTRLTADIQEVAICCLCYFSFLDLLVLQSLVSCCLCDDLEPNLVLRILEVVHAAFRAGHIQVADYTSFHITLLSRFHLYPEKVFSVVEYDGKSNRRTFRRVTSIVCSCLSQIGDSYLVFQLLEKIIVDQICAETPMDNKCAFLRLLSTLDSRPTRLSDKSIVKISHFLPQYLIDVVTNIGADDHESTCVISAKERRYYLIPTFYLFHGSKRLLDLVLNVMGSWLSEFSSSLGPRCLHSSVDRSTMACAIGSVLFHMSKDIKIWQILLSCRIEMEAMFQNLHHLLSSEGAKLTLEERHKIQSVSDLLRAVTNNELVGHS